MILAIEHCICIKTLNELSCIEFDITFPILFFVL
jgi:hypothetical protein